MALMLQQRCLLRSSPLIAFSSVPANALSLRQLATVQMTPKTLRVPICRASAENGSAGVLPDEEAREAPMIFKDESNGIICYYDENGDLTCEGWDEGPHFQPDPQQPTLRRRRRFTPRAVQGRGAAEAVNFKNIKERMGESLGEVAKESFESSEL